MAYYLELIEFVRQFWFPFIFIFWAWLWSLPLIFQVLNVARLFADEISYTYYYIVTAVLSIVWPLSILLIIGFVTVILAVFFSMKWMDRLTKLLVEK